MDYDVILNGSGRYNAPAIIILNNPLTLLFLIACRHAEITWVLCLPTARKEFIVILEIIVQMSLNHESKYLTCEKTPVTLTLKPTLTLMPTLPLKPVLTLMPTLTLIPTLNEKPLTDS